MKIHTNNVSSNKQINREGNQNIRKEEFIKIKRGPPDPRVKVWVIFEIRTRTQTHEIQMDLDSTRIRRVKFLRTHTRENGYVSTDPDRVQYPLSSRATTSQKKYKRRIIKHKDYVL